MPVHIDRMDTTIEVTPAANPAPQAQSRRADSTVGGQALREAVVRVIEEELAELMRIRGS